MLDPDALATMMVSDPVGRSAHSFVTALGITGQVYSGANGSVRTTSSVLTIGQFDGIHRGHQKLIGEVLRVAGAASIAAGAVTFDRHPLAVLAPQHEPAALSSLEDKVGRLLACGLDFVAVLHVEPDLLATGPAEFVDDVLVAVFGVSTIVVGPNFRFGRGASGDTSTLANLGWIRGFDVRCPEFARHGHKPVSSTRIRAAIAAGDTGAATKMLGYRPASQSGTEFKEAGR